MMDDSELAALARGMLPFVHDYVAEAFAKTTVPADVAEQVANAVRMLHESPSLPAKNEDAPVLKWPLPRVARIERDENGALVPIYEDEAGS